MTAQLKKRLKQLGGMEGAPDWYGTPLSELHFEWSHEEKLEIERYCEKILKNIEEEGGMTPLERFKATFECKPRDRVLIYVYHTNVFGARILDSHADAIKPIDVFRNPKLWVKINLANVARYKLDFANAYGITYGEELWGGKGMMIEYGNPVMQGDPPIKSLEDLERLEIPDPTRDGLYPGYLWANRELRRIYDQYGLSKVMPIFPRICGCPLSIVMMYMIGWANFGKNLRKNPEFNRRCLDLATEFEIKYGQAVYDAGKPNAMYMCAMTAAQPPEGNEWLADYWAKVGKHLAPQVPVVYGYAFAGVPKWLPILWNRGALGPGTFSGGSHDPNNDYKPMIDFHQEHNLWISSMFSDKIVLDGPASEIEEATKQLLAYGKRHQGFCYSIGVVDYWTPPSHLDAAVAAAKKYGRY